MNPRQERQVASQTFCLWDLKLTHILASPSTQGFLPPTPSPLSSNIKLRKELQRSVTTAICVTRDTVIVHF